MNPQIALRHDRLRVFGRAVTLLKFSRTSGPLDVPLELLSARRVQWTLMIAASEGNRK